MILHTETKCWCNLCNAGLRFNRSTISPSSPLGSHILVLGLNHRHFKLPRNLRQGCWLLLIVARESSNKMKLTKSLPTLHELPWLGVQYENPISELSDIRRSGPRWCSAKCHKRIGICGEVSTYPKLSQNDDPLHQNQKAATRLAGIASWCLRLKSSSFPSNPPA